MLKKYLFVFSCFISLTVFAATPDKVKWGSNELIALVQQAGSMAGKEVRSGELVYLQDGVTALKDTEGVQELNVVGTPEDGELTTIQVGDFCYQVSVIYFGRGKRTMLQRGKALQGDKKDLK